MDLPAVRPGVRRRRLRDASEVDEQVRGWLTEAFLHASGEAPRR
jgi:hypothetical protein